MLEVLAERVEVEVGVAADRVVLVFPLVREDAAVDVAQVGRTAAALDLLLLEERDYTPQAWQSVRYVLAGELIEPEISDVVKQAQIRAFCRSFLDHFPA